MWCRPSVKRPQLFFHVTLRSGGARTRARVSLSRSLVVGSALPRTRINRKILTCVQGAGPSAVPCRRLTTVSIFVINSAEAQDRWRAWRNGSAMPAISCSEEPDAVLSAFISLMRSGTTCSSGQPKLFPP